MSKFIDLRTEDQKKRDGSYYLMTDAQIRLMRNGSDNQGNHTVSKILLNYLEYDSQYLFSFKRDLLDHLKSKRRSDKSLRNLCE